MEDLTRITFENCDNNACRKQAKEDMLKHLREQLGVRGEVLPRKDVDDVWGSGWSKSQDSDILEKAE